MPAITLHTEAVELPEQTELAVDRTRDAFQLMVDADVTELKVKTAAKKWPERDARTLFHRYVVGADDVSALKGMIRRANVLTHTEAVFYKNGTTEAGHVVVKFHVTRKPLMKDGKQVITNDVPQFVKDETLNADGTPKKTLVDSIPVMRKAAADAAKAEAEAAKAAEAS